MLAFVDSLNPATIATMMIILPLVQKKWHALLFIKGTFLVYWLSGVFIYLGISKVVAEIFIEFIQNNSQVIALIEGVIGGVLFLFGCYLIYKLALNHNKSIEQELKGTSIKVVNPYTIFILAISSTFMDLPTAFPLFGLVGILSKASSGILFDLLIFTLYVAIYVLPMLLIYIAFSYFHGDQRYKKIENFSILLIKKANLYLLPFVLVIIGIWLVYDGVIRFLY